MENIVCPHCGKNVELTEAIIHQLSSRVREEEKQKLKAEFEKQQAELTAKTEKELRKEFELESKQNKQEVEELQKQLQLKEKESKEAEEKIKKEATEQAIKESRLEKLELEKKLRDTQQALEDAQRKVKQGSQQLQGEVLELELEERLKETFPQDEFVPIPKGVEGADIWQKVRYKNNVVGSILWETKRTKQWSNQWITKLKEDMGKVSATEAIIVSQALPNNIKNFDRKDGIWLTIYEYAENVARYIRFLITTVATVKSSTSQTDEEWGKIRDYMLSDSFKHRMQHHFDNVKSLRENLETEKRTTVLRWKRQEAIIDKLGSNINEFHSDLKVIAPDIPEVESEDNFLIDDGQDETLF